MPEGHPADEASSLGNSYAHRAELKNNAVGISRSLSEVFAYLTHGTASLEEARTLLTIITNVYHFMLFIIFICIIQIVTIIFIQLDFKPANVQHASLRTIPCEHHASPFLGRAFVGSCRAVTIPLGLPAVHRQYKLWAEYHDAAP